MKSNRGSRRIHELTAGRDESLHRREIFGIFVEPKIKSWFTNGLRLFAKASCKPLYKFDKSRVERV